MKLIYSILLLLTVPDCYCQPTGYQKLFLKVSDGGDSIPFQHAIASSWKHDAHITYGRYQLIDASASGMGFSCYAGRPYIHKTLMTKDHRLQLVRNESDTMDIEIFGAFNVYFLHLSFQEGKYRIYVDEGFEYRWQHNTLPLKPMEGYQLVFNITPPDWKLFEVKAGKPKEDYFISRQFKRLLLLAKPVMPEDDPNFRSPRRINHLKMELGDYNFDGHQDYREQKWMDTTKRNYFIYDKEIGYALDTLLSSMDFTYFDDVNKKFVGRKETRIDPLTIQNDIYEFLEGEFVLVRKQICVHASHHSEKIDCTVYEIKNGQMILKEFIPGAE